MLREIWVLMLFSGLFCLFLSMLLFFIWGVPSLIEELSGRKAKKQIELMRSISSNKSGIFSGLSTSEVYMGISSGSLLVDELNSIKSDYSSGDVADNYINSDYISTSDIEDNNATTYMVEDSTSTTYVDESILNIPSFSIIKVLEEQSSL